MTFTSPGFLYALPLAGAPLLLHLFSLRRAKRVPFGDLALLREAHAKAMPRARLKSWLLAAARCLVLAFLILAYAGPVLPSAGGRGPQGGDEGLDLVLLLDSSYSMGYRTAGKTRFDLAREAGEALIRELKPGDRVAVGVFGEALAAPLQWVARPRALELLSRARLGSRGTDFAAAVKPAYELLSEVKRRRAVVLLSDGARHGVKGPLPSEPGVATLALEWEGPSPNSLVSAVELESRDSSSRPLLKAFVKSYGAAPRGAELEIWSGRSRVAAETASPSPGRETAVSAVLPPPSDPASPAWSGRASLRPDALSADDAFYFSFRRPRRPRVLVLYGNPDFLESPHGGYFLKEFLGGAQQSLAAFDADFLELARLPEARLSDYQAVALADFKEAPAFACALLDQYVRRGGGLWLIPGSRTMAGGFSALDSWLPARVGPAEVSAQPQGLRPDRAESWTEFDLRRVSVWRLHRLEPRAGASVLLSAASGAPLLVAGRRGEGRVAVWGASLDPGWSNLAVKPAFAAWVELCLRQVSPAPEAGRETLGVKIGEPLVRAWGPRDAVPARVRVRSPDGRVSALWVKDRRVEYRETSAPGLYTLMEDGAGAREVVYAVNLDRSAESDLAPAENPPWRKLRPESVSQDFLLAVYGEDARARAFGAALLALVLEMLLSLPARRAALPAAPSRRAAAALLAGAGLLLAPRPAAAQASQGPGDRFVWTQLKLGEDWDPYPGVSGEVLGLLSTVTSVLSAPERREITLKDRLLFSSPLVILAGRRAPPSLGDEELGRLRSYLTAGGMLWIEDVSGASTSGFDRWVRRLVPAVLPEAELAPLEPDHVIYKTFFLMKQPAGRVMARGTLEGAAWAGRTAIVYSRNDVLGAWAKDALGRPLFACVPGGEPQRHNAKKLAINIVMYSLTGSYKSDAVHQPFLLQKMRSGIP